MKRVKKKTPKLGRNVLEALKWETVAKSWGINQSMVQKIKVRWWIRETAQQL